MEIVPQLVRTYLLPEICQSIIRSPSIWRWVNSKFVYVSELPHFLIHAYNKELVHDYITCA